MSWPKLAVFDVDGTLLDEAGVCQPRPRAAVQALRSSGVVVAIATGRPATLIQRTVEKVGEVDWAVTANGASLTNCTTGDVIAAATLDDDAVKRMVARLRAELPTVGLSIEFVGGMAEEAGFSERVPEEQVYGSVADAASYIGGDLGPVLRVVVFDPAFDSRLSELAAFVDDVAEPGCQVTQFGLPIVEVSIAGTDKAVALEQLGQQLRIDARDVLAFGDGRNDIGMLRWAGTGVAMGNAHPATVAAADTTTSHVNDGGVAAYLEPLLAEQGTHD